MAFSFLTMPDPAGFDPSERRTLRMIAELLDAMSRQTKEPKQPDAARPRFVFGNVEVDTLGRQVTVDGTTINVTPREYDLLFALAAANGSVVTSEELRVTVWQGTIERGSRAISQCVSELRRKLERDPHQPQHIRLVRNVGYRLEGKWLS